jgi:hypothetical protein
VAISLPAESRKSVPFALVSLRTLSPEFGVHISYLQLWLSGETNGANFTGRSIVRLNIRRIVVFIIFVLGVMRNMMSGLSWDKDGKS